MKTGGIVISEEERKVGGMWRWDERAEDIREDRRDGREKGKNKREIEH